MSRGVKAVEMAMQLNMVDQNIRPSISMDMKTEILDVEIFQRLQMDEYERVYRCTVDLANEKEVRFLERDLKMIKGFIEEEQNQELNESDICAEVCARG